MKNLQQKINYQFKNNALLKLALTHRSIGKHNNERLEFLGDSVLGLVISRELHQRFTNIDEGKLSRLRSSLVRGKTLAKIGLELELSNLLILGAGELKSGGFRRESIQADCVEAIFGAILLDSDFDTANRVILDLYQQLLDDIDLQDSLKDAKTQLQEHSQKHGNTLPEYTLIKTTGKDHNAVFTVNCQLKDQKTQTTQTAKSIKIAQQLCAQILLDKLGG